VTRPRVPRTGGPHRSAGDRAGRDHAARRGLDEPARDADAVARAEQAGDPGLHLGREPELRRVELHLDPVQERVARVQPGRERVHRLEHLEHVGEVPVGQDEGEIARGRRRQGGGDRALRQTLRRRAPSEPQVSEPLHDDGAADEVREVRDVPAVGDRLAERLGEAGRDEDREVRVARAPVGVRVPVHRDHVLVGLERDLAVGADAEGPHAVAERARAREELELVQRPREGLHHLGRALHPHPDVHEVAGGRQAEPTRLGVEPLGPGPPGGEDHPRGPDQLAVREDADEAPVLDLDALDGAAGSDLDAVGWELLAQALDDLGEAVGADVPDPRRAEREPGRLGEAREALDLGAVGPVDLQGGAELDEDLVHLGDEPVDLGADGLGQAAPGLRRERELAVAERAGAPEARGPVRGIAQPLGQVRPLLEDEHAEIGAEGELAGGEQPCRPRTHDDDVGASALHTRQRTAGRVLPSGRAALAPSRQSRRRGGRCGPRARRGLHGPGRHAACADGRPLRVDVRGRAGADRLRERRRGSGSPPPRSASARVVPGAWDLPG